MSCVNNKKGGVRVCTVFGCQNRSRTSLNGDISFHKFPRAPEVRKAWIWACKRADEFNPEMSYVCSEHFSQSDFERNLRAELLNLKPKKILKPGVVPHLKLFNRNPESESSIKRRERYRLKAEKEERDRYIRSVLGEEKKLPEENQPTAFVDLTEPDNQNASVEKSKPILPLNPSQQYYVLIPNSALKPSPGPSNPQSTYVVINPGANPGVPKPQSSVQPSYVVLPKAVNSAANMQPTSQPEETDVHEQLRALQTKVSILEKLLEEERLCRIEMLLQTVDAQKESNPTLIVEKEDTKSGVVSSPISDDESNDFAGNSEDSEDETTSSNSPGPTVSLEEEKPSFVCSTCNAFFDSWDLLNSHITSEHFQIELVESESDEQFVLESIETSEKVESEVGECKICKKFFTLSALRKHEQTHDAERPYICSFCDKTFALPKYLKKHELAHSQEDCFECDTCDKTFSQKSNLKVHQKVHAKLVCRFCNMKFPFRRSLLYHEMKSHKTGEFDCPKCDSKFTNFDEFRFHEFTHTKRKPFRCSTCEKEFLSKYTLEAHKVEHMGENPFKCEVCDRKLSSKNSLACHMRIHTGEKPYKCPKCDFATAFAGTVKSHMRTHTGERPYKCQYCKRSFSSSTSRRIHEHTHTGDKPYKCKWCPMQFSASEKLKTHINSKHPYSLEEENQ